uniref:MIF4G domain-containing protein n=1 Tax=Caenorhabditis tropicalis TaxID=1561998 RepID=A0A1I7SYP2_9PELO
MIEIRENTLDNEKELRSLDSTLKKTTSFMKKVKLLSASTVPQLIEELSKLNLSKFVEEMASGIIETKLKLSDIPKVTELCLAISAKYSNFSEQIAGEFKRVLPVKKSDKIANVAKLRVDIIFLAELCLCGVFNEKEGLQVLGAVLSYLIQTDKTEFVNVGLLATVSRAVGWQIANIIPIPLTDDVETVEIKEGDLSVSSALSDDQKKSIRELFKSYYDSLYSKTEKVCSARNKAMKKVKRQERVRGDAADEEKTKLNDLQTELDTLRKMASEIARATGVQMKPLKEEASDDEEDEAANLEMGRQIAEGEIKMWNDEETKAFYEDLIDLRLMVPKDLYKESEQRTLSKAKMAERIEDIDVENINEAGAVDGKRNSIQRADSEKETSPEESNIQTVLKEVTDSSEDRGVNKWQKFVLDLDHLVSKYSTDKAAEYFVSNLNNKGCRKRLVKLMVDPPPTRIDVVPFYARLIATLENVMPDLTTEIVTQLLEKFRGFLQQKSSAAYDIKVERKMVCVMMIAELMKFGVVSRAEGLSCLRQLVYDLRGHSVEMTATFMESGGLYLYRHTESHAKMKRLLEVVKAKRERMKDQRQTMLIDNAYFTCLPPEDSKEERLRLKLDEEDTPMKRFIRHIILDINEDSIEVFLKCFRRLDWSDPEISDYAIRYLSSTWLLPINNLQHVASAIAGLCNLEHFQWIGMAVIDATIETIRISLENPGSFNQWAHSAAVYLAELYSFELCDEDLILQVLYQIISYPEPENSWKDLHRIRMVCAVLEIVREFFEKGSGTVKLRYFMTYFHRYYFTKKEAWDQETAPEQQLGSSPDTSENEIIPDVQTSFPYEVEFAYTEICRRFRKKKSSPYRWPRNLKEAQDAVRRIEKKFKGELKEIAGDLSDIEDTTSSAQKDLNVIEEDDEDEYGENRDSDMEDEDSEEERQKGFTETNVVTKEEDDDFQRELDRMMGEGFRQTAAPAVAPQYDVTLPAAAKNRFNRNIKFAENTKAESSFSRSIEFDDDEPKSSNAVSTDRHEQSRVTLMIRGKANKPSLKTVNIDDDSLQEKWKQEKAREEQERADMKRLTLGQHRRIELEEEKALLAQLNNSRKGNAKKNPPRPKFPKPHLEGEW